MLTIRNSKQKRPIVIVFGIAVILIIVLLSNVKRRQNEETPIAEVWGTIYGTVTLGPTCPVVMNPPDPRCADKPYAASLVVTTPDGARVIKTFSSDVAGKFNIEIPSGEYAIRSAAAANILPYCQSGTTFSVPMNDSVEVQVSCDTGIR